MPTIVLGVDWLLKIVFCRSHLQDPTRNFPSFRPESVVSPMVHISGGACNVINRTVGSVGRQKGGVSIVNSNDIDDNTWPRSAGYRECKIEVRVDEGGRKRNPIRMMTQEDIGAKQHDSGQIRQM